MTKAGKKVLEFERTDRPGGYAHGFRRKRFVFDAGVHLTSGCGVNGYKGGQVIAKVLKALDVFDAVEFIRIDHFSVACYQGLTIALPQTIAAFVETLSTLYPHQNQGLTDLMAVCLQISEELAIADEIMAEADAEQAQKLLPALFQYRRFTLA